MIDADKLELLKLDAAGFLPAPGADIDTFQEKVQKTLHVHREFDRKLELDGTMDIFGVAEVTPADRIDRELVDEVAGKTGKLYGFSVRHVPGFYLTKAVGVLWGGCMLGDPDENFSVLLLRNAFKKHRRFLNYTRDELLAHELCHSVRQSLTEITLEEYFAYQTSSSPVRRYLGNCFIRERDALLFLLPMLLLPLAEAVKLLYLPELPTWIFWGTAMLYPLFLFCRNAVSRHLVSRARAALHSCGTRQPEAILFRCTRQELKQLADFRNRPEEFRAWAEKLAGTELRWQIICHRFIDEDMLEKLSGDNTTYENC